MQRYSEQHKLDAVQGYRSGDLGLRHLEFKLEVLRTIKVEELSCRQAGALFNVRRFDTIASWERAYEKEGIAGLMSQQPTRRESKTPGGAPKLLADSDGAETPSRQELLEELEALRTENAYLKKIEDLSSGVKRSRRQAASANRD